MKILITSDWYEPAVNGVVTSIKNLRTGLEARGHEVRILTLAQTPRAANAGSDISYIGSVSVARVYPGARLRTPTAWRVEPALLAWKPDIIHSNCEFSTFHPACYLAQHLNVPLVHTWHTVYEDYAHYFNLGPRVGGQIARILGRRIADRVDCLIAPTEKTARILQGYEIDTPVRVIPTGIDLSRFGAVQDPEKVRHMRAQLGIPEDHLVLACIGRLAKEKNTEELLGFMTGLRDLPVTMLLVGGGPYQQVLEAEADRLAIRDQVVFTGMVAPQNIADYYQLGDLFICASTSETQGLTYLEALACGLPLLCRADPCLDDMVLDGVNGWQYHSEEEFRAYLLRFLEHPELRAGLRQQALATAQRYSIENFALQAENVYLEMLRCPAGSCLQQTGT